MPAIYSLDQVRQASLFEGLGDGPLREIVTIALPFHVDRQTSLFHQGELATRLWLILEGQVRLVQLGPDGHQVTIRYVGPGSSVGVIVALTGSDYPLTAEAVTDTDGLYWRSEDISRLMERYPRLALNGMHLIGRRFHDLQLRYRELATERVERRVARALLRLARQSGRRVEQGILIDLPLSRQDLGEMTGTTLYTVSRILRGWEEKGLIVSSREQVIICSPHGLVSVAEDLAE